MAIVETKTTVRPNANIAFHRYSGEPAMTSLIEAFAPFYTAGNIVANNDVSGDGLTLSMVRTIDSLETWSTYNSLIGIALNQEHYFYTSNRGISTGPYSLTGIDQPFTCTTTYTFPSAGLISHDDLSARISSQTPSNTKLSSVTVHDTSIVCIHTYNDSSDYTTNHWSDYMLTPELQADGVTRTIQYAYVS